MKKQFQCFGIVSGELCTRGAKFGIVADLAFLEAVKAACNTHLLQVTKKVMAESGRDTVIVSRLPEGKEV